MADMRGLSDDSEMGPTSNYQPNHAAQYPQPAYSYARGHDNFGVDQDMNLVQGYGQEIPPHMNQIDNAMQESNDHVQAHNLSISTTSVPGMAPPRTPQNQSFSSPTNPRPSIDGSQDLTNTGEGSKRKRSKVSRACDECRRKKIRCDATDDDGNIKTCTNCARAGQTCDYSRVPMKRGPSKGYIKELSERVQQVESQMAMSGGSQTGGYRQSLDGNMPMYPESSYSPDDPMSFKRNFSFSEARSGPFSQPQFNRDRMPSTGGWSNTSAPRPRDRGSVAVAPDQLPDFSMSNGNQPAVKFSKPFWSQEEGSPAKRQKIAEYEVSIVPMEESALLRQIEVANSVLPIFTTTDASLAMMKKAPSRLQHAAYFALSLVLRSSPAGDNVFQDYGAVEAYALDNSRISPEYRSREENCTWMLLYLAMIINADQDLARFRGGDATTLPKVTLLNFAIDLGRYLRTTITATESGPNHAFIRKAWNFTCLLTRLHSISAGIEDVLPVGSIDSSVVPDAPPSTAFLIRASEIFSLLAKTIQSTATPSQTSLVDFALRKLIEQHLDFLKLASPAPDSHTERIFKQLTLFIEILLSRFYSPYHPAEVLAPALELAASLGVAAQSENTWTPLTVHLYTLVGITLLEFTDVADPDLADQAYKSLGTLQDALDRGTYDATAGYTGRYWADGLKNMIAAKIGQQATQTEKEKESRNGDSHATSTSTAATEATSEAVPAPPAVAQQAKNGESTRSSNNVSTTAEDASTAQNGALTTIIAMEGRPATVPAAPAPAVISLLASETISVANVSPTALFGGDRIVVDPKSGIGGNGGAMLQLIDFRLLLRHGFGNVLAERNGY